MNVLSDSASPVDWAFSYKVPKLAGGATGDCASGYEYAYFDSEMSRSGGAPGRSPCRIDQGEGWLGNTLRALFCAAPATTGYVVYNDERPDGKPDDGNLGHTKGVLGFDLDGSAFWLLHSWPKFPSPDLYQKGMTPGDYPTPIYGQTNLALSLGLGTLRQIAAQMLGHQEPQVYATKYPLGIGLDDPLYLLGQGAKPNAAGDSSVLKLATAGGMPFWSIAKNRKWNDDYWNDLVGPALGADMDVETWIRGPIAPTADLGGLHTTTDIKYINATALGTHWVWPETADHAKWGVSCAGDHVVVADINRMISQRGRGGGGIAFQDPALWLALKQAGLVLAPPGHTLQSALGHVKATHVKAP